MWGVQQGRPPQPSQPSFGQNQQQPTYQHQGQPQGQPQPGRHAPHAGQSPYAQPTGQSYGPTGQASHGQAGQTAYGSQAQAPYGQVDRQRVPGMREGQPRNGGKPPGDSGTRARLIGAVVLVLAALATTGLSVGWIWTKADAVTPVDLPSGGKSPIETVSPSVKPSETPTPVGKVLGTEMVAANNDTMPIMSSAWTNYDEYTGLSGGAAIWYTVHKNYDGKGNSWGNYAAFGQLAPDIPYANTPAGLKEAAVQAGGRAILQLYDKNAKLSGTTHRAITVSGHPGHEITTKVAVSRPGVKETFSTVMIAVIDRGDKTADVAIADIAGSTPAWQRVWRFKVGQIKINN